MLEGHFQKRETAKLNQAVIQNDEALYEGRYTVKEEISRNLGKYLRQSFKHKLGVNASILVKTKDDRILYPADFNNDLMDGPELFDFSELPVKGLNYMEVAAENYRILNDGLILSINVKIKHNGWLSNSILVFYVFAAALILKTFIRKAIRETDKQATEQKKRIEGLTGQLTQAEFRLKAVETKEEKYINRINKLKEDKKNLSEDIDGLLEEMEKLEAGLESQKELKEETEFDVLQLREELDRLKGKLEKPKKKKKKADTVSKRFKVLYRDLAFTDRAIEGFVSLSDEFQLKAEEVIHKLNKDESQVSIKRKVFGKGGKMNVLEADFSYSGRIYFQKDSQSKTQIMAIGTKNTQDHDLAFIEKAK